MPRTATRAPRTPRKPTPQEAYEASHARYSAATSELGAFAAKLVIGQTCEGGCGDAAEWAAIATDQVRWGCAADIGKLLDNHRIWYLHGVGREQAA